LWKTKPIILETASITCPIAESRSEQADGLLQYGDNVHALVLYTREAHPGSIPHHRSYEEKKELARTLAANIERPVLVDDLEGSLHRKIGELPNSVYVIDTTGTVVMFSTWNQPAKVDEVVKKLITQDEFTKEDYYENDCRNPTIVDQDFGYLSTMFRLAWSSGFGAVVDLVTAIKARGEMIEKGEIAEKVSCKEFQQ
jgi:hypothetical protein